MTAQKIVTAPSLHQIQRALMVVTMSLCLLSVSYLGWASPALAQPLVEPIAQTPMPPTAISQAQSPAAETSAASPSGDQLFIENCAACHSGGGNIIRRGKTLKQKALKRYGYEEVESIISLITLGKGAMPAFEERLADEEVSAIAQYVQTQAASNWK